MNGITFLDGGMGTELRALSLADRARDASGRAVRVAGSLPPLRTSYRADEVGDDAEILADYRRIAETLAPKVDILLCETLSSAREARAAVAAACETGVEVWLSWTLQGDRKGRLPSGAMRVCVTNNCFQAINMNFTNDSSAALSRFASIKLVTAVRITGVSVPQIGGPKTTAMFTSLTLRFIPEPSAPIILVTGAIVLAILGQRSRRR